MEGEVDLALSFVGDGAGKVLSTVWDHNRVSKYYYYLKTILSEGRE